MSTKKICFDSMLWNAILTQDRMKDLESCECWVKRAAEMKARIIVPSVIIAEVHANPNRQAVEQFRMSLDWPCIEVVDTSKRIAELAGELRREVLDRGWSLKSLDSLVIASAQRANCDYLFSDDTRVLRMDRYHSLTVRCVPPDEGLDDHPLFNQGES